jgi:hypothetical protein
LLPSEWTLHTFFIAAASNDPWQALMEPKALLGSDPPEQRWAFFGSLLGHSISSATPRIVAVLTEIAQYFPFSPFFAYTLLFVVPVSLPGLFFNCASSAFQVISGRADR